MKVQDPRLPNRPRNFLAIGADILNRRSTDGARNSAEAFHARALRIDGPRHETVPIHARPGGEDYTLVSRRLVR